MEIEKFLEQNIEGYLFHDVEKMMDIELNENESCGACGYPIIMTILSGMELLGFLLGNEYQFNTKNGNKYFKNYWENYFCKFNIEYNIDGVDGLVRNLIRHGLAHNFLTKPNILIYKKPINKVKFVDVENGLISIDVEKFYFDFKNSYEKLIKNGIKDKSEMQKRLNSMIMEYSSQSDYFFKEIGIKLKEKRSNDLICGASVSMHSIPPSGVFYDQRNKRLDNF